MNNDWRVLLMNADRYREQGTTLMEATHAKGAVEQFHLALEMIIKAAIMKLGGQPKEIHDLEKLIATRIRKRKDLLDSLKINRNVNRSFSYIKTAWNMHNRYDDSEFEELDAHEMIENYERVFNWIKQNFVE